MSGNDTPGAPFTVNDIEVGTRLAEALVQQAAAHGAALITARDVLTLARGLHPKDAVLGRAVPVGIGMKLRFVAAFCSAHDLPPLACLVVHDATMQPILPPPGERDAVAAFDWSVAAPLLPAFAALLRARVPARLKPRKERPADVAWYAYFCSHRAACAWIGNEDKQEIINLIMAGLDPETAQQRAHAARAELGPATSG